MPDQSLGQVRWIRRSRTIPTRCRFCGTKVFYYEDEFGSKVFFDELGPPWPKHSCAEYEAFLLAHATSQTSAPHPVTPPEKETNRILEAWDKRRREAYKLPIRAVHPERGSYVFDLGIVRELIPTVDIFRKLEVNRRSLIALKLLGGLASKEWAQLTVHADDLRDKNIASYTMLIEKPHLNELNPAIGDLVAFEAHGYAVLDRTFWVCELLVWPELAET